MPNNYYENQTTEEPRPAQPVNPDVPPMQQQIQEEIQPNTEPAMPNNSNGQLVVRVFTASDIYPVVGADVTVETENEENREVLGTSVTDRSGRTTTFTLPAPSATASQEPTASLPFAQYRVTIKHPDFFDAVVENVQIFGARVLLR